MTSDHRVELVLALDSDRQVSAGSPDALAAAIRCGADLHISTEFRHNEHVDTSSDNSELVRELAEFPATYLVEDRWVAGIMTLRQPVGLPDGFGPRPSMSFFMYNQNGCQAIARPYLDRVPSGRGPGPSPPGTPDMPKLHELEQWDAETNAPSNNFIYDFERYDFLVRNNWTEVLAHSPEGDVISGSALDLGEALAAGNTVKVGVRGLCDDLVAPENPAVEHETFVQVGSSYYYTEQELFIAGSHPLVRVRASIPMQYTNRGWDFGWLLLRSDGQVVRRLYNPYTLEFCDSNSRHAIRWFTR